MTDVVLFHHALGLTAGVADELRGFGHHVTTPDLFGGATFTSIDEGVAHAEAIGFDTVIDRGVVAVTDLDGPFVIVGLSLGVLPAQRLAQSDERVAAAVLVHSAVPLGAFGEAWPRGVRLQIHLVEGDPWAEEDLPAARELAAASGGDLHLHPGTGHLVLEQGAPDHDPEAAGLVVRRILGFLDPPESLAACCDRCDSPSLPDRPMGPDRQRAGHIGTDGDDHVLTFVNEADAAFHDSAPAEILGRRSIDLQAMDARKAARVERSEV